MNNKHVLTFGIVALISLEHTRTQPFRDKLFIYMALFRINHFSSAMRLWSFLNLKVSLECQTVLLFKLFKRRR